MDVVNMMSFRVSRFVSLTCPEIVSGVEKSSKLVGHPPACHARLSSYCVAVGVHAPYIRGGDGW